MPKQFVFDWKKFAVAQRFSREFLDQGLPPGIANPSIESTQDWLMDTMLVALKAYVLTHQLAEHDVSRSRTVSWPASPWQHWKQRHGESWWLRWLVQRRPVRMQHEVVDFREAWTELAAYPWQEHLPAFPALGRPTRIVLPTASWSVESQSDGPQVSYKDAPWMRRPGAAE